MSLLCVNSVRIQFQTLNSNQININKNLVKVQKGCVVLFSACDFEGEKREICANLADLRKLNFDKKVASILIGEATTVVLKKDYSFKGMGVELKHNVRCFDKMFTQFRKNISSLVISQIK